MWGERTGGRACVRLCIIDTIFRYSLWVFDRFSLLGRVSNGSFLSLLRFVSRYEAASKAKRNDALQPKIRTSASFPSLACVGCPYICLCFSVTLSAHPTMHSITTISHYIDMLVQSRGVAISQSKAHMVHACIIDEILSSPPKRVTTPQT